MSVSSESTVTLETEQGALVVSVSGERVRARLTCGRDAVELTVPFNDLPGFAEALDKAFRRTREDNRSSYVPET